MKRNALRQPYLAPAWSPDAPRTGDLPPLSPLPRPALPSTADHDLLVPNARPDLTLDLPTLWMIQVG